MTIDEIKQHDGAFRIDGWPAIAWRFYSVEVEPTEDTYWDGIEQPTGNVLMVMVGDDEKHVIDPMDVIPLDDDAYCSCCGQIGCPWG